MDVSYSTCGYSIVIIVLSYEELRSLSLKPKIYLTANAMNGKNFFEFNLAFQNPIMKY
mgnify:CR=1 FL=1